MCISLEKNIWKIIFGQGKVRENCRGPSAATLFSLFVMRRFDFILLTHLNGGPLQTSDISIMTETAFDRLTAP